MKTLKSMLLGLIIITVFSAAKAADKPAERLSKYYAINTYVDAMTRGKIAGMNDVVDASAKFNMLRGTKVLSFGKTEMVNFLKTQKDVEQTCTVSTSEVEDNDNVSVVRVDMQYKGFVRSNYVTVANTGNGWKITNVYSVFK